MKAELLSHFGDDLMVVNAARVSYGKSKSVFDEKDAKLIKYLIDHKHIAPFRHPQLQFRVQCPIFVERQLFKHQVGMCLSGETKITFINSSSGHSKTTIKELYEKWENGRPHQSTPKDAEYTRKRIKNKKIRVLNEKTNEFEISHVKNIYHSGTKPVFNIKLENGKNLRCSSDHLIFTDKGWKTINNGLSVGHFVACNGVRFVGNGKYRDKIFMADLRNAGYSVAEMAEACGCGYDNIRKWLKIHGLCFSKSETCFPKENVPWNKNVKGYKLNISDECLANKKRLSRAYSKKGAESKWWRGGITKERAQIGAWTRTVAKEVHRKYNFTCQKCGKSSGYLHAHHIIPVVQNRELAYDVNNLISVCGSCHKSIHKSLQSEEDFAKSILSSDFVPFEYKKRIGIDKKKIKVKAHFSKIISIQEDGVSDCYDLEIDGNHHNFVANGIVVHNSANSISGRYVDFSDSYYRINQLRQQSKSSKQGSEGVLDRPDLLIKIEDHVKKSQELYKELCLANVAKEQARVILPLSLETTFIWTGSLLAFVHFWNLRLKKDTQEETREIAQKMLDLVKQIEGNPFKHTIEAFGL